MVLTIKHTHIQEFAKALKRMKVKHGPFYKSYLGYQVEIIEAAQAPFY